MKIAVISDLNHKELKTQLIIALEKYKFDVINLNSNETNNIIHECDYLKEALNTNKVERGIVIDDFGIAPFMYLSKNKGFIVAEIADEHSAKMTAEHNGSNILTFAAKISTIEQMINMSLMFLSKKYSSGRHQSRIDMMNSLLSKEK